MTRDELAQRLRDYNHDLIYILYEVQGKLESSLPADFAAMPLTRSESLARLEDLKSTYATLSADCSATELRWSGDMTPATPMDILEAQTLAQGLRDLAGEAVSFVPPHLDPPRPHDPPDGL